MTAALPAPAQVSGTEKPTPLILRRGEMSQRERWICVAVWHGWAIGVNASRADITEALGVSRTNGSVSLHIKRLCAKGWLWREAAPGQQRGLARTIRPGSRFVGLDSDGWPLEVVE